MTEIFRSNDLRKMVICYRESECLKNFADCVILKFEYCDSCCFKLIFTTTMSPLHCV